MLDINYLDLFGH